MLNSFSSFRCCASSAVGMEYMTAVLVYRLYLALFRELIVHVFLLNIEKHSLCSRCRFNWRVHVVYMYACACIDELSFECHVWSCPALATALLACTLFCTCTPVQQLFFPVMVAVLILWLPHLHVFHV